MTTHQTHNHTTPHHTMNETEYLRRMNTPASNVCANSAAKTVPPRKWGGMYYGSVSQGISWGEYSQESGAPCIMRGLGTRYFPK